MNNVISLDATRPPELPRFVFALAKAASDFLAEVSCDVPPSVTERTINRMHEALQVFSEITETDCDDFEWRD